VSFTFTVNNSLTILDSCLKYKVLTSACKALEDLVQEANTANVSCVAAVSHSAFLRVLVGMLLDEPLLKSASRKIYNGSVTVIDIPKNFSSHDLGDKPMLLGGPVSQIPKDFTLEVPTSKIIRINEFNHLPPFTLY
jgi:broad specificity phosphatase PhoE